MPNPRVGFQGPVSVKATGGLQAALSNKDMTAMTGQQGGDPGTPEIKNPNP